MIELVRPVRRHARGANGIYYLFSLALFTATTFWHPRHGWTQVRFVDFESSVPKQVLTNQYAYSGVVFSPVLVQRATSLAHSGNQFVQATHGQITITFSVPVRRVTLWVGYRGPYMDNLQAGLRAFSGETPVVERWRPLPAPTPSPAVFNSGTVNVAHALEVVCDDRPITRAIVFLEPMTGSLLLDDLLFEIASSPHKPVRKDGAESTNKQEKSSDDVTPPPKKEPPVIWSPPNKTLPMGSLPDLQIRGWEPRGPQWISVVVGNGGAGASGVTFVVAVVSGFPPWSSGLGELQPGAEQMVVIAFHPLPSGVHEMTVTVDPKHSVKETEKNNNTQIYMVSVVPDLSGLMTAEAESHLQSAQLSIGGVTEEHHTSHVGHILRQNPLASSIVPTGTGVTLVVVGPHPIEAAPRPDLRITHLDLLQRAIGPPYFHVRVANVGKSPASQTTIEVAIAETTLS